MNERTTLRINVSGDDYETLRKLTEELEQSETWIGNTLFRAALKAARDNGDTLTLPARMKVERPR